MKFHHTEFAHQLLVVVLATLMFVMSVAFVAHPATARCESQTAGPSSMASLDCHLT